MGQRRCPNRRLNKAHRLRAIKSGWPNDFIGAIIMDRMVVPTCRLKRSKNALAHRARGAKILLPSENHQNDGLATSGVCLDQTAFHSFDSLAAVCQSVEEKGNFFARTLCTGAPLWLLRPYRVISSVGRALRLHRRCQEFESLSPTIFLRLYHRFFNLIVVSIDMFFPHYGP